jgi:hypothetical protein
MVRHVVLALVASLGPVPAALARSAPPVKVQAVITRLTMDSWRVDYTFDTPVSGIAYGPPAAGYRARAWSVLTPGISLVAGDEREDLVAADTAVSHLSVMVRRHTAYASDQYAPLVPFSDGGAALYLGYFAGDAILDGEEVPLDVDFGYVALPGEHVLPPNGQGAGGYVYFGPQQPVVSGRARLLVDAGAPAWLHEALPRVTEATSRIFSDRLRGDLAAAPLVLVGAAEVDSAEGVSVKGGAVGDQFVMLLRGRGLNEGTAAMRGAFERLTAHELAHLWQLRAFPSAFQSDEPWLHEGAAEAMAVSALGAAGLWDSSQVTTFAEHAEERCRAALEGGTLPEAARRGSSEAIYGCGFGLYWSGGADPFLVWSRLADAVSREGRPYSQATLDRVRAMSGE